MMRASNQRPCCFRKDISVRIQISLGSNATSPGPARGKRGFQAASGRSQCAPVNPAGPSGRLWVPALGSEWPGPQCLVSRKCRRPGVHPEAVWELLWHRAWLPVLRPLAGTLRSLLFRIQISLGSNTTSPGPARGKSSFWAASGEKSVCSGESSRPQQEPSGACFVI